ncbi:orotidine-5'-phosphate decarboxylase [Fulvivirgaceae bacterium BMA12]|uniref:Orotidine 5'-phosphate decarboxylase n=1 Tax=Agaribacillus aureus TaxID=3051825 RepID=A0ABT8L3H1_9BACT|nr:orotidine-5'-phosphate decarboxylase [Fulvivirgaceae bacterium BMA12]
MTKEALQKEIQKKRSYLCVGLDTDINKIPAHLLKTDDPIFEFNRQIIDATADLCVAYKPNIAFYEALGTKGWESLQKTLEYIPDDLFTIADAKRGDIGNTSRLYARAFFQELDFDSITVAPYMGRDSVLPFLDFPGKWVILLALTSNPGSRDFQQLPINGEGRSLYEQVLEISQQWAGHDQLMYVVGATQADHLANIRKIVPDHFLLVPGVGAQGGDLEAVSRFGMNKNCGLLVNSTRGIIYSGSGLDFAEKARTSASEIRNQMSDYLEKFL